MEETTLVILPDGRVQCWGQDVPELVACLENWEERSTCECAEDVCPAWEMPSWHARLARGEF